MDVVVGGAVDHQVLLVGQLLRLRVDVAGLITSQVVLRSGQTQVSRGKRVMLTSIILYSGKHYDKQ